MAELPWLARFLEPLERLGFEYAVTGSVAAMLGGEARLTIDVDVIIRLPAARIEELIESFPGPEFFVPPREVIEAEVRRDARGHFTVIETEGFAKADFYVAGHDPLHAFALERRRSIRVGGVEIHVAPLEYVIVRKLEFFREGGSPKHLRDVSSVLAVSGDSIDPEWVEREVNARGLQDAWRSAQPEP